MSAYGLLLIGLSCVGVAAVAITVELLIWLADWRADRFKLAVSDGWEDWPVLDEEPAGTSAA